MTGKTNQRLRLTLRQLEVFAATARAGSTRAAADQVARSQSAASTALAELEAALGVQLFDRVGRRLVLNENGNALLPRAAAIVEQAAEAETLFSAVHAAPLRLASSFTIGEYLLPHLISQWKAAHPQSRVMLAIANTSDVLRAIGNFDVDLGFIESGRSHPEFVVRRWLTDELIVVAAPGHPLARRRVTLKQLEAATWIVREQGSGTREASDRWLTAGLGRVEVELELGSNEAVKRVVASGLGIGCLSRQAVVDTLREGWLVELRTPLPPMRRSLAIVVHRTKRLGSAAQDFLRHCLRATPAPP
ncbi:MAG TPA: LysR family transcriptional regulator [Ideonella sp.]|nr:LysR family transcriptional regulator [Ideonella sp.]